MSACHNCGSPLARRGKRGPAPTKWCSGRCQSAAHRRAGESKASFEAMRELLSELAPMGLTDECPARRAAA